MKHVSALLVLGLIAPLAVQAAEPARILINQLGYDVAGPKQAVVQGIAGDRIDACSVRSFPGQEEVLKLRPKPAVAVDGWRDWRFWSIDFGTLTQPGEYVIACTDTGHAALQSYPFLVQHDLLERHTLSDVLAYFKAERVTGAMNRADANIPFADPGKPRIDARGGWYDATGDYGVHLSQLDFTSYFNTQQVPLVVYALGRSYELLDARNDANFNQLKRRLIDEATYGADFLVRMHPHGGSFYETIDAPGPGKKPEDRRIDPVMTQFSLKKHRDSRGPASHGDIYQASFRSGGGFAIAALALAARLPLAGDFDQASYLHVAEGAFAYLEKHNAALLNDGRENIIDDYSALLAASELLRTTHKSEYRIAARRRADNLMARLVSDAHYRDYWRADDGSRPFFHPSDAGAPVVALLDYYPLADAATRARIKDAVRRSLQFELTITNDAANPFGLARQYVQTAGRGRRAAFFFPHDTEAAPWWQGENARLASLATAARLALPLFADDPAFSGRLRAYAADQLDWILGLNPFDAGMLQGVGHNNPEYLFFSSWQYTTFPGGIVNGITAGYRNGEGIDYSLPYAVTRDDSSWRWDEQWLPHAAWYLLAVAARDTTNRSGAEAGAGPPSGESGK